MATKTDGTPAKRARRTQEERRATTRAALLDATIECLAEYGYANTTTTKVVEHAGVSRGAQVHHFPTKASLVAEAVAHLAQQRTEELRKQLSKLPSGRDRPRKALDLLWEVHQGPLFEASLELWVAARTDPELRRALRPVELEVISSTAEIGRELFGDYSEREGFGPALLTSLTAIHGLAMRGNLITASKRDLSDVWASMRGELVKLFA